MTLGPPKLRAAFCYRLLRRDDERLPKMLPLLHIIERDDMMRRI